MQFPGSAGDPPAGGSSQPSALPDDQLAILLATGNSQAFAQLYDRYADRIYSYSVSFMGNRDLAGDVVQDTFLLAYARIGQLRDKSRLRPWLYAIARNECLRQIRQQGRGVELEAAGDVADMSATLDVDLSAQDARALIDAAYEGMNSSDREVLDLALRQDLDNGSIAAVLGVNDNNAAAKVSRAKSQLERAVGALLLFRSRATGCAQLRSELGAEATFTPLTRKRIARHTESCATCSRARGKAIAAIALAGLPILTAPTWLRGVLFGPSGAGSGAAVAAGDPTVAGGFDQVSYQSPGDGGSAAGSGASSGASGHGGSGAGSDGDSSAAGQGGSIDPDFAHYYYPETGAPPGHPGYAYYYSGGDSGTAEIRGELPPEVSARILELDADRPPFDSRGWPRADSGGKRWPWIAGAALVGSALIVGVGAVIAGAQEGSPQPAGSSPSVSSASGRASSEFGTPTKSKPSSTSARPSSTKPSPTPTGTSTTKSPSGSASATKSGTRTSQPPRKTPTTSPTVNASPSGRPSGVRPTHVLPTVIFTVAPVEPPPPPIG